MASKRILKELKDLQKDPPTSCSAAHASVVGATSINTSSPIPGPNNLHLDGDQRPDGPLWSCSGSSPSSDAQAASKQFTLQAHGLPPFMPLMAPQSMCS